MESNQSPGPELTVDLSESRYDRQQRVSWWDQDRLMSSRVLVVGAGALGNEVVKTLALVGVGSIVVIDLDVVEMSNLARCVFFSTNDEGRPKALVLAEAAARINPDISICGIVGDFRSFGTGLALRADVMIGALDNRETRLYCNRLAARVGRPWVDGAIEALSGVVRVFDPPTSCYECTLTDSDWEHLAHRQSCRLLSSEDLLTGKVPTTASTSSVIAGLEVQEAIKLLHRDREGVRPLTGAIVIDGANNDAYPLQYPVNPDCLAHHRFIDPIVIDVDTSSPPTAAFVAGIAWPDSGGAVVDLGDNHLTQWWCPDCEVRQGAGVPATLIHHGDSLCPSCNGSRQPAFVTAVQVPGPLAEVPLFELGVRSDELLSVRVGGEERHVWLRRLDERLPRTWDSMTRTGHG
jgi:adenylyltransferase/sulfurtransferase